MNGWGVFAIIIILILLALAVLFLVLWLVKKENKADAKKELAINGLKVVLTSDIPGPISTVPPSSTPPPTVTPAATSTITATWDSVGNSADQVTMYADVKKINLDSNGQPENTSTVVKSNTVSGNAKNVAIKNLPPKTRYFIEVVVTNPNLKGSYNAEPFSLYTDTVPIGEFTIVEIDATGGIELSSDNKTVTYSGSALNKNNDDLWKYDFTKFTLTGNGQAGNPDPVLYNNSGVLAATSDSSVITPTNSQWIYDRENKWCLKSSPNLCLSIDIPVSGSTPIKLVSESKSQWQNITFVPNAF